MSERDDRDDWARDLPEGVRWREWEGRFERKFKVLRQAVGIAENYDETRVIQDLRRETLLTLQTVLAAAVDVGDPEYLLKVLRQSGRLSGLEGPSIAVNFGSSDALPDLSHVSDEDLAKLTSGSALEALPGAIPDGSPHKPERHQAARASKKREADDDEA